jgi:hypothetical protein
MPYIRRRQGEVSVTGRSYAQVHIGSPTTQPRGREEALKIDEAVRRLPQLEAVPNLLIPNRLAFLRTIRSKRLGSTIRDIKGVTGVGDGNVVDTQPADLSRVLRDLLDNEQRRSRRFVATAVPGSWGDLEH